MFFVLCANFNLMILKSASKLCFSFSWGLGMHVTTIWKQAYVTSQKSARSTDVLRIHGHWLIWNGEKNNNLFITVWYTDHSRSHVQVSGVPKLWWFSIGFCLALLSTTLVPGLCLLPRLAYFWKILDNPGFLCLCFGFQ